MPHNEEPSPATDRTTEWRPRVRPAPLGPVDYAWTAVTVTIGVLITYFGFGAMLVRVIADGLNRLG